MIDRRSIREVAVAVTACAGVLLLADLGLGWFRVAIVTGVGGSTTRITVNATGWTNVGLIAGFVTIAMLVYLIRPMRQGGVDVQAVAVTAALGLASVGFTIAAAFTGTSSVTATGAIAVIATRQWAAYAGMALAAVAAVGAVVALTESLRGAAASPPVAE
ncbi:MAG TPA: hypothetical protein VKR79_12160 [Gaiellaceae bacterium]|nr:hypothetical protein [Gaiellaceae bacterium]